MWIKINLFCFRLNKCSLCIQTHLDAYVKCSTFSFDFYQILTFDFIDRFSWKSPISNFTQICLVGVDLIHEARQTWRNQKAFMANVRTRLKTIKLFPKSKIQSGLHRPTAAMDVSPLYFKYSCYHRCFQCCGNNNNWRVMLFVFFIWYVKGHWKTGLQKFSTFLFVFLSYASKFIYRHWKLRLPFYI